MLLQYKKQAYEGSITKRLEKISKKNVKVSMEGFQGKQSWDEQVAKAQKKVEKLSQLKSEREQDEAAFEEKYKKDKVDPQTGVVKYNAEEHYASINNRAELYDNTSFSKTDPPPSYTIAHNDDEGDKDMSVVATFDAEHNSAQIIAEIVDSSDLYVLHMVEQANMLANKMASQGKPKSKVVFTIDNCEDCPESALKLELALEKLGLKSKMEEKTKLAVEQFKEENNGYQVKLKS